MVLLASFFQQTQRLAGEFMMNARTRFRLALVHQEPDRVPFDIGGSIVTGIAIKAYERLIPALGLPPRPTRTQNTYSQTAALDEDFLEALDVDTRILDFGDQTSQEPDYVVANGNRIYTDEWQITYSMPLDGESGFTAVNNPLAEASSVQEIETYAWPDFRDPVRYKNLAKHAKYLSQERQVGVILETRMGGIFEWPAWLRGTENFLSDLAAEPSMAEAVITKVTDLKVAYWEEALSRAGHYVDMVRESDDLGGQKGLLISPRMYRRYFKKGHRQICDTIKKYTDAAICLHSCGSVWDLIPDFIEVGFTVLNPVQVSAVKMDPKMLKQTFGDDLVFWGGTFDSQQLGTATPKQVLETTQKHLQAFKPGGGYIFAPINVINADVPAENVIAMWQVLREQGAY
jgi:uroporphyrinogen decarboxylase